MPSGTGTTVGDADAGADSAASLADSVLAFTNPQPVI
jgi:hypothetical protein